MRHEQKFMGGEKQRGWKRWEEFLSSRVKKIAKSGWDTLNNENLINFNLLVSNSYFPIGN